MTLLSLVAVTPLVALSAFSLSAQAINSNPANTNIAVITNTLDAALVNVASIDDANIIIPDYLSPTSFSSNESSEKPFGDIDAWAMPGGGGDPGDGLGPASEDIFARLNTDFTVSPHTTDLLGESVDVNNGNVSFRNTDIVIPGNGLGLDIVISRTIKGAANSFSRHNMLADWTLDFPAIQTTLLRSQIRYSGSWGIGKECSGSLDPGSIVNWGTTFGSQEYWNGDNLQLPGGNGAKLLENNGYLAPSSTYKRVTQSNWKFSCFNRSDGQGEGFIGYAPNGLKYTFDKLRLISTKPIIRDYKPTARFNAFMLATKVEDRFGNFIQYNYTGNNLTSITTNDSRTVIFNYNHPSQSSLITSISFNGRTWHYEYANISTKYTLTKATRPDGKFWSYDLSNLAFRVPPGMTTSSPGIPGDTWECSIVTGNSGHTASITHPDGITGTFVFEAQIHGRSNVMQFGNGIGGVNFKPIQSRCYPNHALAEKTLSGPSVSPLTWNYTYSGNLGTWTTTVPDAPYKLPSSAPVDAVNHKSTTVEAPDGSKTVYYYNRDFSSFKEGSLIVVDKYDKNGTTLLSRTESNFVASPAIGSDEVLFENSAPNKQRIMQSSSVLSKVDGSTNTFTTTYNTFDIFGYPQVTSESNNFNGKKRYTKNYYTHDTTNWLIGLPSYTQVSSNGSSYTETSRTTYHSSTGSYKSLPYEQRAFGRWYKRNTSYHTYGVNAGLPNRVDYNGPNRWVYFSNYKRGIAQTIRTPQSRSTASQYAYKVVDNNGWVTKQTDFLGQCINYGYDSLGRMNLVDPCDTRWLSTSVSYSATGSSEGLNYVTDGMFRQLISRGNYQKTTYFDSLLRPVMSKEWDTSKSSTARYTRNAFDAANRPTFQSFAYTNSTTPYGVYTTYDGLGRSVEVDDNSTSGSVSYNYLSNNRVQVNDNKGNVTTTTYLAYGTPEQGMATLIASPHSVNTTMVYDIYGNLTTVNQGGLTEYRVYDTYKQLCKTVRNDVGNTAFAKDALGQVSWQARGSSVDSSTTACDTAVSASDKATFAYDNLGNVKSVLFGDSSPDQSYVYDANSRLETLTAGNVVTAYEYNSENLIEKETMSVDGQNFSLDYIYNNVGNLTNTVYPSGANISYSPNALGQATQAGGYANYASYHANGMVKSHLYGNYATHTSTQNTSGLPSTFYDKKGSTYIINHSFTYDANNNLTKLTDYVARAYDLSLSYDGLDRLDVISDSYLGSGDVNYDTMGNITYYKLGSKTINYYYNSSKRLDYTTGSKSYNFNYDAKGNVTDNGTRGFTYNAANQMVQSDGYVYTYDGNNKRVKEQGSNGISYSFYASNGKLMYRKADGLDIDYYYLGGKLVANKKGNTVTYLHSDYLGSTAAESTISGSVFNRMHYQPFGESIETPKDDIGYTGHKFDTDLGLNYMQARYYDPVIGRFYSNDPVDAAAFLIQGNIQGFSRYVYANNNPFRYTDPNGMAPESFEDWKNLASGTISYAKGAATMVAGGITMGFGVVGVALPEPGTTLLGIGLFAVGSAALPIGSNEMLDGLDQMSKGWNNGKESITGQDLKMSTAGSVLNEALGIDGSSVVNLGKAVDGAISQTANAYLPASSVLTTINNASTMNDISKLTIPEKKN
ncbi:RHS repeat-associated core domain-containing protein [Paraglaciecola sp. 25GB23A]|uniref:RHS repeat domain-containing protein n=1 Tax=Paraglaciecola sp. 25GB23A TaxID=3156068 RepID=UPI0032AF2AAD